MGQHLQPPGLQKRVPDMTQIIGSNNDRNSTPEVLVGDGATPVPIKFYQDIYHQITGRTEQIQRRYKDSTLIEFGDIEQLYYKINQLCDVHHVVVSNEIITVFHEKDRKEQFTSFERFKLYNTNSASHCRTVVLKFNFSIAPAGIRKPQEYVVTAKLTSRVGLMKQFDEDDIPSFMRGHFVESAPTAEITVDYADYVVARGFMEAFDEWIKGVKKSSTSKLLLFIRSQSHYIPEAVRIFGAIVVAMFALTSVDDFFASEPNQDWARFFVVYGGGAFIIISLLGIAGSAIERAIDGFPTLSYIHLNKGDELLISEFNDSKRNEIMRFTLGCLSGIALNIAASRLEKLI